MNMDKPKFKYAHMCREDHTEIGHNDSEHEQCPLCRALALGADMREALQRALALFEKDHALDRFDWGKSALRAQDIRELNETPPAIRAALALYDESIAEKAKC